MSPHLSLLPPMSPSGSARLNRPAPRLAPRLALLAAASLMMAGCDTDNAPTGGIEALDYHTAHPIVLAHAPTSLDVFPGGSGLDVVSRGEVHAFVARYRRFGAGPILIMAPQGRSDQTRLALEQIRKALVADGVRGNVNIGSYPPSSVAAASPIRLTYVGLKAGVRQQCGQWPHDLASTDSAQNANYWNFGCATQTMFAAQLDDPRDLVQARELEAADVQMRTRAIGNIRTGLDPATAWGTKWNEISQIGSE